MQGADAARLVEPLGLLQGAEAREAIAAGLALPLAGRHMGYALARLMAPDGAERIVPVAQLPGEWRDVADRLAAPVPDWAGLGGGAVVMGIINVTPDSFSDGGDYFDPGRAIEAGRAMAAAGAAILDIGGESTRPDESTVISAEEEQRRVLPVIRALQDCGAVISVDTRNAATMAAALDAGAAIVNDVSGLTYDPEAAGLVARRGCPVALMHMRGTPQTMNSLATYADVALEVTRELQARLDAAEAAGITRAKMAIDPGIGFAKHTGQNRELLARLPLLLNLGCPILVGLSRKRFVREVTRTLAPKQSGPGSLAGALHALSHGARILRVHDVADTVQAVRVWEALAGTV
jgi:dihydropteroate synthase